VEGKNYDDAGKEEEEDEEKEEDEDDDEEEEVDYDDKSNENHKPNNEKIKMIIQVAMKQFSMEQPSQQQDEEFANEP
jgi:hypothetical protein